MPGRLYVEADAAQLDILVMSSGLPLFPYNTSRLTNLDVASL